MSRPPKARNKALLAYCELLRRDGEPATTIDAVAARPELSKGGVLYHFPSKEALAEAAHEEFRHSCQQDLARMAQATAGPDQHYRRPSWPRGADSRRGRGGE